MLAFLTKPLDRWAMRTARRSASAPGRERSMDPHQLLASWSDAVFGNPAGISPPEIQLANDGAFQFPSPVVTPAAKNNTVHGRLWHAGADWARRPTALLLHGWNAELCYQWLFPRLAGRLARAGLNTAMFELPYHMHRRLRTGPVDDFISSDLRGMLEATRQAIADTRALCGWLRARGSPLVGLWGFSLGAWLAGLVSEVEPDLSFAVLTTPIARVDRAIAELPFCAPVRHSLGASDLDLQPLNLASRTPHLEPRCILLVQARHDLFAPALTIDELWHAWRRPALWRVAHGHISILLSARNMARTVEWIREQTARHDR